MKIYTKTGDKGTTKLVDGLTVEKNHPQVEAYGTVDELNSHIGLARSFCAKKSGEIERIEKRLEIIQNQLFSVGSLLATHDESVFYKLPQINETHISQLEKWIDEASEILPELKNFILPAGDSCSSQLHICRTVCRRAERLVTDLHKNEKKFELILIYLNRLSDLFFVWARTANHDQKIPDTIWKKENV